MAKRWRICRRVDDPQLLAISQELDRVLYQFVTGRASDTVSTDDSRKA